MQVYVSQAPPMSGQFPFTARQPVQGKLSFFAPISSNLSIPGVFSLTMWAPQLPQLMPHGATIVISLLFMAQSPVTIDLFQEQTR
jgi:hypothetical protein